MSDIEDESTMRKVFEEISLDITAELVWLNNQLADCRDHSGPLL